MWFNWFKHKKKEVEPQTFEGRFVSEEEIQEMIKPKKGTFIKEELKEINEMMKQIREYPDNVENNYE